MFAQFHPYIWGRLDLVIFTDHKPLTHMFESQELSYSLQQWLDVIHDYRFTIHYRPGVLNVLPDALSRVYSSMYSNSVWGVPATPFRVVGLPLESFNSSNSLMARSENSQLPINVHTSDFPNVLRTCEHRQVPPSIPTRDSLATHVTCEGSQVPASVNTLSTPIDSSNPSNSNGRGNVTVLTQDKSSSDKLVDLLVELDRRGKVNPSTQDEKDELIH